VRAVDADDAPRAGVGYRLTIDGRTRAGVTDADGRLEEPIAPDAHAATLSFDDDPDGDEIALRLGYLAPVTELAGVRARLTNLGFAPGRDDDDDDDDAQTRDAVREFQLEHGLAATGELDDGTRDALRRAHGC
jgi:peptidoglycan hydrolase-like protein with peptidoglycan-binding domain